MAKEKIESLDDKLVNIGKELPFKEQTEIGQVFENLDNDERSKESNMSNIDFNSRLTGLDVANCIIIDELQALGILPQVARITRQKKRLSVSLEGRGRQEKVEIASASRSADLSGRGGGVLSKLMTPRE